MPNFFEVTSDEIGRLGPRQQADLLLRLLHLEADAMNIGSLCVSGTLAINAADGGEDARIEWEGEPAPNANGFIPSHLCMFQSKAEDQFGPAECVKELFRSDTSRELKIQVEEILSRGGTYILFIRQSINETQRRERINAMHDALHTRRGAYENAEIKVYGRDEIAEWANCHFPARISVLTEAGFVKQADLVPWTKLSGYPEYQNPFINSKATDAFIAEIREKALLKGKSFRIVASAGLGKTRSLCEAFRADHNSIEQQTLTDSMVYYDAGGSKETNISRELKGARNRGITGVLVVDNCPLELHAALTKEVEHVESRWTLFTLSADAQYDGLPIPIEPTNREHLREIIKAEYQDLPDHVIARIAEYSGGNAAVALKLAGSPDGSIMLNDDAFCTRLLRVPFNPVDVDQARLCILALFVQVEYQRDDDAQPELSWIAENILRIQPADFVSSIRKFQGAGIIRWSGDFVTVDLDPLALKLAHEAKNQGIISKQQLKLLLSGPGVPNRLRGAFYKRLSQTGLLKDADRVVAELLESGGPFDSAEVMLSEQGSRLFLALTAVNPEACLSLLERLLREISREDLVRSRAQFNIIFALQNLCWRADFFERSALVLRKFVGTEKAHWTASARRQFLTLFHILLPGTEADLNARRRVIDTLLSSSQPEDHEIAIAALGASLDAFQFTRDGGPEEQGGQFPKEDFRPTPEDIGNYWLHNLSTLTEIACDNGPHADQAREVFAKGMMGPAQTRLAGKPLVSQVLAFTRQIIDAHRDIAWLSGMDSLQRLSGSNSQIAALIEELQQRMVPTTMEGKIEAYVSKPSWFDYSKPGAEVLSDPGTKKALLFAADVMSNIGSFLPYISKVQSGEQRKAYEFGQEILNLGADYQLLITKAIESLRTIDPKQANPAFIAGLMNTCQKIDPVFRENILNDLEEDEQLGWIVLHIVQGATISANDLDRVVRMIAAGKIDVKRVMGLSFGSVLLHLHTDIISNFALRIAKFGCSGALVGLNILSMYSLGKRERDSEMDKAMRFLLTNAQFLSCDDFDTQNTGYHWSENAASLLKDEKHDSALAVGISRDIVAAAQSRGHFYNLDYTLEPVMMVLLQNYKDEVWPIFSDAILGGDMKSWEILSMFRRDDFQGQSKPGLFHALGEEYFMNWCRNNANAPKLVAHYIQIFNNERVLDPIAKSFILEFGDDEAVLDSVSSGLWSFGWTGTPIPYYNAMKVMLQEFLTASKPTVRTWAQKNLAAVNESIRQEEKRIANENMGVYGR